MTIRFVYMRALHVNAIVLLFSDVIRVKVWYKTELNDRQKQFPNEDDDNNNTEEYEQDTESYQDTGEQK